MNRPYYFTTEVLRHREKTISRKDAKGAKNAKNECNEKKEKPLRHRVTEKQRGN